VCGVRDMKLIKTRNEEMEAGRIESPPE